MKAIVIHNYGAPDVLQLEDVADPLPQEGQAVVRLMAAGVNFVDIYHRKGTYAAQAELPFTPGLEGSGIVEAVGPRVTNVKVGDRVAYTGQIGSYAEKNLVRADRLIAVPESFSWQQAAAFPLQGMTAHYLMHEFHKVEPGQVVLIHAAAGGMGLLLVQWARHLGAHVIGTASTEEKAKVAKAAGADDVIIYTKDDFVAQVKQLTNQHGADYIIDGVGKTTLSRDLEACAVRGTIVHYGSASGVPDPIDPRLLMSKSLKLGSGSLQNFIRTRQELERRANDVIQGLDQGWINLRIDRVLPLKQAQEAHRLLESRQTIGKIVLSI
jgi:NADPH:quinone reductase